MAATKSVFDKAWITRNAVAICNGYADGVLTLRGLHYQLVSIGMTNDLAHYKKVVNAMIDARWQGLIGFEKFSDLDRGMVGSTQYEVTDLDTEIENAKYQVEAWMTTYRKNRWENQDNYVEVFIEKKALQGVFASVCAEADVALGACKGYPSLTFLHETKARLQQVKGKNLIILYFGDYDASGEDIPRSIGDNMNRFGIDVEIRRVALMEHQVVEWNLPPAPTKPGDTRSVNWGGLGQVELDAVKPEKIQQLCRDAISDLFDIDAYAELKRVEAIERDVYIKNLKSYVASL